jgi:hypothetical protein
MINYYKQESEKLQKQIEQLDALIENTKSEKTKILKEIFQ